MIKIAVFDTKSYDKEYLSKFSKDRNIEFKFFEPKLNIDTVSLVKGYEGIVVFVNDILNKEVIDKLIEYNVKAIFLRCAGYNNVDIKQCYKHIHVYRVPSYSPYAVAEHAFSLISTLNRRIHKAYNRVKEYNFSLENLVGVDLHNKTIGVIGTGKIGKCLINIALGYGMKVIAYDKYPSEINNVTYVDLDTLFKESDFISLHCPLTTDSYHMINSDAISKMKKDVVIINTSRGALIDANALLDAIKNRNVGGACLDVYEEEGDIFYNDRSNHILDDNTLLQLIAMPNVLITSHQAFLTKEALTNIADTTTKNILDFFTNNITTENELCYGCGNVENCKKDRKQKCF